MDVHLICLDTPSDTVREARETEVVAVQIIKFRQIVWRVLGMAVLLGHVSSILNRQNDSFNQLGCLKSPLGHCVTIKWLLQIHLTVRN